MVIRQFPWPLRKHFPRQLLTPEIVQRLRIPNWESHRRLLPPPRAHGQIAEASDDKILLQKYFNAREVYFAEDPGMLLLKLEFRDPPLSRSTPE